MAFFIFYFFSFSIFKNFEVGLHHQSSIKKVPNEKQATHKMLSFQLCNLMSLFESQGLSISK